MMEKDYIQTLLSLAKGGAGLYLHATIEATTPNVFDTFKYSLNTTIDTSHQIFKKMEAFGWYQIQPVDVSKIEQVENKFASC